jgi:hypothetical protein
MIPADKILNRAADYIEEHGWTQGEYHNSEDNTVCTMGAINKLTLGRFYVDYLGGFRETALANRKRAVEAFVQHLGPSGQPYFGSPESYIVDWNDDTLGLTEEQVVHELRIAAKEASGE